MLRKYDILNLEWNSFPSRDRTMATLVCNYLRYQGYRVIEGCIFNGMWLIRKVKPKVLIITNSTGAQENLKIVQFAKSLNIKVITFVSEGNFRDDISFLDSFFWGWNKDKTLYEDLTLLWSNRTRDMVLKEHPELKDRVKVSGGVGFDNYQISKFKSKVSFLKKYSKEMFQKVIGIGCWDFGFVEENDSRHLESKESYREDEIARIKYDREQFNKILVNIISKNKDILFLVKEHPGVQLGRFASGILGLENFNNVIFIKNEEPIIDCISVSDFWMVYDSTTAMEAWLLGKNSCLLNPSGVNFKRDHVHKGSPCYRNEDELQTAINYFQENQTLPGFLEKEKERKIIIQNSIENSDGLNHVRAGNYVISLLERPAEIKEFSDLKFRFIDELKLFIRWNFCKFIPSFRNFYIKKKKAFSNEEVKSYSDFLYKHQIDFYDSLAKEAKALAEIKS